MNTYIDGFVNEMITHISQETSVKEWKNMLNNYLFKKYCEKGYLQECEPEYCTYRYTNSCRYLDALHEIQDKYNLKIFD